MPYLLVAVGAALVGAAVTYTTSEGSRKVLDSATDFAAKVEKPLIVLSAAATIIYVTRGSWK